MNNLISQVANSPNGNGSKLFGSKRPCLSYQVGRTSNSNSITSHWSPESSHFQNLYFKQELRDSNLSYTSIGPNTPSRTLYAVSSCPKMTSANKPRFNAFSKSSGFNVKINSSSITLSAN